MNARKNRSLLLDSLDLSREQMKKMKALNKDFKNDAKEVKENTLLSAAERKEKNKELILKRREAIKKILTPDQYEKYQRMQKKRLKDIKEEQMEEDI